ncbi:hypothetical protein DL239_19130 [Sedimentitalea sp. CY04]|uniref:Sulfotransferase n=1 Tax=Parasedimentitalea denitrificans TaxID=2211118 RepID=A0ABX0WBM7_9RHOB|nr:sulfotransferase [Sedimentitalea sp. CY04]NIZ63084.1 hypothetical protein [Sedimentitalea sp. CY04]
MTPAFILSLPRSGSTLLQRKLLEHKEIATTDEPWILLPLLMSRQEHSVTGIHDQTVMVRALQDFTNQLPNGRADWDAAVRVFAEALYAKSAPAQERYFLDKTPRYSLVSAELLGVFPEARFIILWRDPVAIVASVNQTWGQGKWAVHRHEVDLFAGLKGLCDAASILGSRAFVLRYEELLAAPEQMLTTLFEWLDLDPAALKKAGESKVLDGQMGDPKRHGDSREIRAAGNGDWRKKPLNPLRRRWLRRYLDWIGAERMSLMGYELAGWKKDLAATPTTFQHLPSDLVRMSFAPVYRTIDYPVLRKKLRNAWRGQRNFVHK